MNRLGPWIKERGNKVEIFSQQALAEKMGTSLRLVQKIVASGKTKQRWQRILLGIALRTTEEEVLRMERRGGPEPELLSSVAYEPNIEGAAAALRWLASAPMASRGEAVALIDPEQAVAVCRLMLDRVAHLVSRVEEPARGRVTGGRGSQSSRGSTSLPLDVLPQLPPL